MLRLEGQPIVDIEMSRAYDKTWQAMESLVDKGKTKMIGKYWMSILSLVGCKLKQA